MCYYTYRKLESAIKYSESNSFDQWKMARNKSLLADMMALLCAVTAQQDSSRSSLNEPMPFQNDALRISNIQLSPVEPTWAVVQYEDRSIEEPILELMQRNKGYCEKMGYYYVFIKQKYKDIPPYWAKVKSVNEVLQLRFSDSKEYVFKGVRTNKQFNDTVLL